MITKETCVKIWNCHNEIEKANELMKTMAEKLAKDADKESPTLYNAFGEQVGLKLGVPSGNDSHTLYGVNVDLGVKIIEQHIREKKCRLEELKAIAKIELYQNQTDDE